MLQSTLEQKGAIEEVSSTEAWRILQEDKESTLIDVRTTPEWSFVGVPDLSTLQKELICLSWRTYPTMEINPRFADQLSAAIGSDYGRVLLFICRSGARSYDAALAAHQLGYQKCYNVVDGFEGELDTSGRRGMVNGWKKENIAWVQG